MPHSSALSPFLACLAARLPEVAERLDDHTLPHCAMGAFARATNEAIKAGDIETIRRHFQCADEIFRASAPEVAHVVTVSYLDNLALCGRTAKRIDAGGLLTPSLRAALDKLEQEQNEQPSDS